MAASTKKAKTKGSSRGSRSSRKQSSSRGSSKPRASLTVSDFRQRFNTLNEEVRKVIGRVSMKGLAQEISRLWSKLFNKPLSAKSGGFLAQHFSMLYGAKGNATKGGALLEGAPIGAEMRPGLPQVLTYATFPTEAGADPKAVQDMDVYYNSAIGRSCGTENTSAIPWSGIGSNLVPMTSVGYQSRGGNRRRTQRRRTTKGGNFMTTLNSRAFVASNPSGPLMRASEMWAGMEPNVRDSADPTAHAWSLQNTTADMGQFPTAADHTAI